MKVRNLYISFFAIYAVLVIWAGVRSVGLPLNSDLVALLPTDDPHLATYEQLKRLRATEGGFDAILHIPDGNVLPLAKEFAQSIHTEASQRLGLSEAEIENDLHDLRSSLLYLMRDSEFDELETFVDERIQEEKLRANPFYVDLALDDTSIEEQSQATTFTSSALLQNLLNSKRYRISDDSSTIRMTFYPDFAQTEHNRLSETLSELARLSKEAERRHPGLRIHWGGDYVDQYVKIGEIERDVRIAFFVGLGAIVVFMLWYMARLRKGGALWWIPVDLIVIFFILFSALILSLGIYSFWFDEISLLIGIVFSILFGINLDYILHIYSILATSPTPGSARELFRFYVLNTRPVLVSCLTTAIAVLSFLLAEFDGFLQVGILFSLNLIVNLVVTFVLIQLSPSLRAAEADQKGTGTTLQAAEAEQKGAGTLSQAVEAAKTVAKAAQTAADPSVSSRHANVGAHSYRRPAIGLLLVIILIGGYGLTHVRFDFDFSSLEPRGVQSEFDRLNESMSTGPSLYEPSYILVEDLVDVGRVFDHIDAEKGRLYPEIVQVESFAARFPFDEDRVAERELRIRTLKLRVDREAELLSTLDGDEADLIELLKEAKPPVLDSLPEYILNRFFFKEGGMAPLIAIHPRTSLSDGERSMRFRRTSSTISLEGRTYAAASTSIIAAGILEVLISDSKLLFLGPLAAIALLLILLQRSLFNPLVAMAPLFITACGLSGLMLLTNLNLNLYNVIALPILIGVGADNGIHLLESIRKHGQNFLRPFLVEKLPVLSACSFTTILGFTGLLFIEYPGLESLGWLSLAGVTLTLLATLLWALVLDGWNSLVERIRIGRI